MSGSNQHDRVALVSVDNQAVIGEIRKPTVDGIRFVGTKDRPRQSQEVLLLVAQYTEPGDRVQRVCDHPAQIIKLQKEITDLKSEQFIPLQCDHTEIENQIRVLREEQVEGRSGLAAPGTDEELRQERADMSQDAQQSGKEVHGLKMQLVNAFTVEAREAPATPQAPEDRDQKCSDSEDFSGLDRT